MRGCKSISERSNLGTATWCSWTSAKRHKSLGLNKNYGSLKIGSHDTKMFYSRGTWGGLSRSSAQLLISAQVMVSGHGFKPCIGLCAQPRARLSLSLCSSPSWHACACAHVLSLSQINMFKKRFYSKLTHKTPKNFNEVESKALKVWPMVS